MTLRDITKEMLNLLPEWMEISNSEDSIGAQTLDVTGIQLEDLKLLIDSTLKGHFIQTAGTDEDFDLLNIDYLYKIEMPESISDYSSVNIEYITSQEENIYESLNRSETIFDFYKLGDYKYYIDVDSNEIYFKLRFKSIRINGALFGGESLTLHHVWGPLDEIGLLIGCSRIKYEKNTDYKSRLDDVFRNPGNASEVGLINYISRSLGISKDDISIDSLNSEDFIKSLTNDDGSLSTKLKEFIEISNKVNTFDMNEYWNILDETALGIKYLPIVWDSGLNKWDENKIQNGIGDTNDLMIRKPEIQSDIQNFEYALFAEGLAYPDKKIYPEHNFQYKLYSEGHKYESGYSPEEFHYTVTASELIPLEFDVIADKIYYHDYTLHFGDSTVSTALISPENYHETEYVKTDNMILVNGSYVPNKHKRYFQLAIRMESSSNSVKTPVLNQVALNYTKGAQQHSILFETLDTASYNEVDNQMTIGFEAVDNWDDATITGIRFKQDTNDSYRTEGQADGSLTLTKGDYQKLYDSAGDWDDGIKNKDTVNVRISSAGNLRLSI